MYVRGWVKVREGFTEEVTINHVWKYKKEIKKPRRGKGISDRGKIMNKEPKYKRSNNIEELPWFQVGYCEGIYGGRRRGCKG